MSTDTKSYPSKVVRESTIWKGVKFFLNKRDKWKPKTMIFRQLNTGACKTYQIGSEEDKETILVDPLLASVPSYLDMLKKEGWKLNFVLDTHTHADHISGCAALRKETGAKYIMHRNSGVKCVDLRITEADNLKVGDITLHFLHTPGHTRDSVTILMDDHILTGDFLFIGQGGIGRTDLPGGDPGDQYDSLQKLKTFDGSLLIYPAHDYHQKTHSTLDLERKDNEHLKPHSREEYIKWLTGMKLPEADWMIAVLDANSICSQDPKAVHIPVGAPVCEVQGTLKSGLEDISVKTLTAKDLKILLEGKHPPLVLDVRVEDEYIGELGHISGSKLLPVGELQKRINEVRELAEQGIVTVCKRGERSRKAAAFLIKNGIENAMTLEGGMEKWNEFHGIRWDTH